MRLRILPILAFCLLALQCTGRHEDVSPTIQFYLDGGIAHVTKGVPYSSSSGFPVDEQLGLIAYQYDSPGTLPSGWVLYTEANTSRTVLYNADVHRWIPTPELYYPSGQGYVRFFAFGPKDEYVTGISAANHAEPSLSYTVPSDIADQKGLLVATPDAQEYPPRLESMSVPLTLQHVLSGVRFAVYSVFELVSITVSGVCDQGQYDMYSGSWRGYDKSVATPSYTIEINDYAEDMEVMSASYYRTARKFTLMMIPQRLPEGARITYYLANDANNPHVIDVSGQLWEKGKEVTYIIADEQAEFQVIVEDYPANTEELLEDE